jgi:predicted metal-dependent hydrolase
MDDAASALVLKAASVLTPTVEAPTALISRVIAELENLLFSTSEVCDDLLEWH